ncbi:hypothetical protein E3O06_00095 [Cryobacterium glaciale]|uniref:Uncharacterized protein n=1 Tax=Cryobacterium glaciale TaxID=1259145 RepID=A0A4R8V886_9MICO|nr:hypothetical protein [Cryobacterium glaciale]TFB77918.1 hypothetical protein E3O06_00095 [Cryobacterium glaciale]
MQIQRSTIDPILRQFFDHELAGKAGLSRSRIEVVERRLRECLEAEAERILVTGDLEILAAERQFMQDGEVARTMHADDLVFILLLFVCDPWLRDDPVQRATQLRLAEYLTGHLLVARLVDREQVGCPLIDIRVAIDTEKVLRRSRAAVPKRRPQ